LVERFDAPAVRMEDMQREFSGTPFLKKWEKSRANCNYPVDLGVFDRIRHMALPTIQDVFNARTRGMPRSTEVERLAVQRVGQGLFRCDLLRYWRRRCAITGLAVPELLRASHAKPWACCENDNDRLDLYNGLLLASHLDAAFENGFIAVAPDGAILVSDRLDRLDTNARRLLGLDTPQRIDGLDAKHLCWLTWHRENKFGRN